MRFADKVLLLPQSDVTHPSISVGIRTRKQGMENDDRFVQVPDENSLEMEGEREGREEGGGRKNKERRN